MKVCDKCGKKLNKKIVKCNDFNNIFSDLLGSQGGITEQYEQANLIINYKKVKEIYDLCDTCARKSIKLYQMWIEVKEK